MKPKLAASRCSNSTGSTGGERTGTAYCADPAGTGWKALRCLGLRYDATTWIDSRAPLLNTRIATA